MLVQMIGFVTAEGGAALAEVLTPVGAVTARWCGEPRPSPGAHHVEWELDTEFLWGQDILLVEGREERVRQDDDGIALRGRLCFADEEDDEPEAPLAHLELAGSVIDLGRVEGAPTGLIDPWVELRVAAEKVALHPYVI